MLSDGQQSAVPPAIKTGDTRIPRPGLVALSLHYGAGQTRQVRPPRGGEGKGRGEKVEPSPSPSPALPSPSPWTASNDGTQGPRPWRGESWTLVSGGARGPQHSGSRAMTHALLPRTPGPGLGGGTRDSPALAVQEHGAAAVHKGGADGREAEG